MTVLGILAFALAIAASIALHEAGAHLRDVNVIASPAQELRNVFDLMPTDSDEDWETIAHRLRAVPEALDGWFASLDHAASQGIVAAQRQIERCSEQCAEHGGRDGYFLSLAERAAVEGGGDASAVQDEVREAAALAARAYADAGARLRDELLPRAPEHDGVGRERYALHSREFLGARVDLEETYRWGQDELARITDEMSRLAERIAPGAGVKGAMAALDADDAYALHGTDALRAWMQASADAAVSALADTHFDIPDPVRRIECMIAPTSSGGIYYTGPSEDFSRPGRMWWAVPKGVERFGTWRELTTVYHEGVPGHHLQIGQTMYRSGLLNRWRRLASWTSGHGEGWALYAEWLMAELGHMDDPGNRMGMLDGQSLRAARVVLDIGVHCGFEAPAEVGGGDWTYDKSWAFLNNHCDMDEGFLRFELDRYLGWPGQAPSYVNPPQQPYGGCRCDHRDGSRDSCHGRGTGHVASPGIPFPQAVPRGDGGYRCRGGDPRSGGGRGDADRHCRWHGCAGYGSWQRGSRGRNAGQTGPSRDTDTSPGGRCGACCSQ